MLITKSIVLEFLLEVLGGVLFKVVAGVPGAIVRYLVFKVFKPKKKLIQYLADDPIEYNVMVGLVTIITVATLWVNM